MSLVVDYRCRIRVELENNIGTYLDIIANNFSVEMSCRDTETMVRLEATTIRCFDMIGRIQLAIDCICNVGMIDIDSLKTNHPRYLPDSAIIPRVLLANTKMSNTMKRTNTNMLRDILLSCTLGHKIPPLVKSAIIDYCLLAEKTCTFITTETEWAIRRFDDIDAADSLLWLRSH